MSAVARADREVATVPAGRAIAAEALRWRGSTLLRLPWLGVGAGAVTAVMSLETDTGVTWEHLLAYLALWVTGFGPLAAGLVAATAAHADRRARGGGTWWRPVDPRSARLSRFGVVMAVVLVTDAAAVGIASLATALVSADPAPVGRLLATVVVVWLGQSCLAAVVLRVAAALGRLPGLLLALVWLVLAVLAAERAAWWLLPPAWLVRGALPLVGTHANGIVLGVGEPLAGATPWVPALLSLVAAVVVLLPDARRGARW